LSEKIGQKRIKTRVPIAPPTKPHKDKNKYNRKKKHDIPCRPDGGRDGSGYLI